MTVPHDGRPEPQHGGQDWAEAQTLWPLQAAAVAPHPGSIPRQFPAGTGGPDPNTQPAGPTRSLSSLAHHTPGGAPAGHWRPAATARPCMAHNQLAKLARHQTGGGQVRRTGPGAAGWRTWSLIWILYGGFDLVYTRYIPCISNFEVYLVCTWYIPFIYLEY
jgi:hypothetical protein